MPRMYPLERLVDLVALLLDTRRPLTFDQIRERMPEAYGQQDEASARRMFERDKDTLREVGVPVELESTDAWEVEKGYRIPKDRYYLPEIEFTPDEMWALFVAAHAPGEDVEAQLAFHKLSASGAAGALASLAARPPAPGVDASGPHLGTVAAALARRRAIAFGYRPLRGRAGRRTVDPYALVYRAGNWYVVGRDHAREDIRAYRLSRIASAVREAGAAGSPPEGFDAAEQLEAGPWGLGAPAETARVRFSPKVGWLVAATTPGARVLEPRPDGWSLVELPASNTESFVSWVLSYGADAVVEAPAEVREQVVARLRDLAGDG